jgi:hypothetical protein
MLSAQSKAEKQILALMAEQEQSWNRGDIDDFMNTYWKSDSLMFIGKSGVTYGWANTLANYKKGYPDTASMGKLNFTILKVKRLSAQYYNVIGRWYLTRTIGNLQGAFTLIFKKINKKWLIVQDHSS